MRKNPSTRKHNALRIARWYFGNYCAIKCNELEGTLFNCYNKLEEFAKKYNGEITHQEFLELFENYLTICKLPKEQRRKYITWRSFARIRDKNIKVDLRNLK